MPATKFHLLDTLPGISSDRVAPISQRTLLWRVAAIALVVIMGTVLSSLTVSAAPIAQTISTPTLGGPRYAIVKELTDLASDVFTRPNASSAEGPASIGQVLQVGGTVRTGPRGNARIDLSDGSIIRVSPNSMFSITTLEPNSPTTQLKLELGKVWVYLSGGSFRIETPVGVAAVRGSYIGVYYNAALGQLVVSCLETKFECVVIIQGVTYTLPGSTYLTFPVSFTPSGNVYLRPLNEIDLKDWLLVSPELAVRGSSIGVYYNAALGQVAVSCLETKLECVVIIQGVTYTLPGSTYLTFPASFTPSDNVYIRPLNEIDLKDWLLVSPASVGVIAATNTPQPIPPKPLSDIPPLELPPLELPPLELPPLELPPQLP